MNKEDLILKSNKAIMMALHQGLADTLDEDTETSLVKYSLEIEECLNPSKKPTIPDKTKDAFCEVNDE